MDKFWVILIIVFVAIVGIVTAILAYSGLHQTRQGDVVGGFKTILTLNDFLTIVVIILIFAGAIIAFIKGKG